MWIVICVLVFYALWAGLLFVQWRSAEALRAEVFDKYRKDGTLNQTVPEEAFTSVFMRCEGPRLSLHLFVGALFAPFAIIFSMGIFNFVWDFVWERSGRLDWFEVGELPHSLMLIFLVVGVLFCVAWVLMRRYHLQAPGSLRSEIRRLNGDTT